MTWVLSLRRRCWRHCLLGDGDGVIAEAAVTGEGSAQHVYDKRGNTTMIITWASQIFFVLPLHYLGRPVFFRLPGDVALAVAQVGNPDYFELPNVATYFR